MKKILVPTDFSERATEALRHGGELAAAEGAELIALYADTFEPPVEFTSREVGGIAQSIENSRRRAQEELERCLAQNVPPGVKTQAVVIEDLPVPAIVGYAKRHAVDLIVMGTHGRSALGRILMGSVAARVVAESPVPVRTIREGEIVKEEV
jgi:nucleotide-binding universal stress UspA family protein